MDNSCEFNIHGDLCEDLNCYCDCHEKYEDKE